MSTLQWIIAVTVIGGILSVLVAGLFLLISEQKRAAALPHLISFATGALLGAALLNILPQAIESVGPGRSHLIGLALVAGIFAFFILQRRIAGDS